MDKELLDVLDPSGRPLHAHAARPRNEIHRLGLWHETVHVWIVNSKAMILFQKRASSKESYPGLWDVSAAGHVSSGETALRAAQRETAQELGLNVAESDLTYLFTVRTSSIQKKGAFVDNEFNRVYLTSNDLSVRELKLQESEVEAVRFIPCKVLERLAGKGDPSFAPHPDEYAGLLAHLRRQ